MTLRPEPSLRSALFAVAVAHGLDLTPGQDGVLLPGPPPVLVGWDALHGALGVLPASAPRAPAVLAAWLRLRSAVAAAPELLLADGARVVGLPVAHVLHPGPAWVVQQVPGGVLDLGIGVRGLDPADAERVVLVPPDVWDDAGLDPRRWWRLAQTQLEEMGALAVLRLRRDPPDSPAPLRPMGDTDAVTLLGSATFRAALAAGDGGMAAIAVPMRRRGWLRLSLLDPAFAPAAAAATDEEDRGFVRPLLVTAGEVALARDGGWTVAAVLDGRLPAGDASRTARGVLGWAG